ncbi:enoyl-CoA hydratase-related protein [Phenylobacterium sp.]|uniref:enoyl-CoA hydratase-related protein n=1 Tax=Phenylobacterium sp. TaxID=1871053 RepID=UPI002721A2FA|nr:enoyl-CoA hydratase-related protein [Phenylobacterium sp.]MDO8380471.1 enoyl-CoA hydratase-related protein [Phenylobacterium sp.]
MTNPIADPLVEVADSDIDENLVHIEATVEGVATVTINRPARRNAFDARLIGALREAFETLQGAEGVRVVFLRGAGGMFSAGADLDWMREAADRSESDNRDDAYQMAVMLKSLWDIPALTVALVEGGAFGGGAGLAAVCDLAVATATAKFSFSEVRLGLIAATISPYVVGAVGPRAARALFATGSVFDAAYAEKVGLITEVVADTAALEAARDRIAGEMMTCAPGAVADSKKLVEDVAYRPIESVMEETAKRIARTRVSPEGQEGVRAFLDKRKPSWVV